MDTETVYEVAGIPATRGRATNDTSEYEINIFQQILELLPWCTAAPPLQDPLFHAAHALFLVGYLAPPSRLGMLSMHGVLVAGFLAYSTWAWNVACARDIFSWGLAFALLNLGQLLQVLYQTRPVKTDRQLETVYTSMFKPLNVDRVSFKRLMSSDCCHVTSLHAGEAYAMQGLTPTDRLGLLLTGEVNVMSGDQFLHSIAPLEFLDSPEFESSRAVTDDKFKVSIVAATTSRYLFWRRINLEYQFLKDQHLATALSTIVARDITSKLYSMNSKIVTESGTQLDIRLPSLTSTLNPCLVGVVQQGAAETPHAPPTQGSAGPSRGSQLSARSNSRGADAPGVPLVSWGDVAGVYGSPKGYCNSTPAVLQAPPRGLASLPNGAVMENTRTEHPLH